MSNQDLALVKAEQTRQIALNMGVAQSLISRDYLTKMEGAEIIPLKKSERECPPQRKIRLLKITSLIYDKRESITEKLNSMFCALSLIHDCNIVLILNNYIDNDSETLELYMGLSGKYTEDMQGDYAILERSIRGNFPGCEIQKCYSEEIENLMPIFTYSSEEASSCAISSISVDAIQRGREENFIQGMEKFADGMRGNPYTLMMIATPISGEKLAESVQAYRQLYTELSPYKNITRNWNETTGEGQSISFGTHIGETLSRAKTNTTGTTTTVSSGTTNSTSQSQSNMQGSLIEAGLALTGFLGGALIGGPSFSALGGAYFGSTLGRKIADVTGNSPTNVTKGKTNSVANGKNISESEQFSSGTNASTDQTLANSFNTSKTVGLQMVSENKHVSDMLKSIDKQIDRMSASFGQGAYNIAAYVVASDRITSSAGASLYRALLSGNQPDSVAAVNTWDNPNATKLLQEYLVRASHPRMRLLRDGALNDIDLTTFVPCSEMPLHFFWPRKSLPGLPVSQQAEFVRSMPFAAEKNSQKLHLGKVYHLGKVENNSINLPLEVLCSHTCIAGSPGSGKSNLSYQILAQIMKSGVHFLVVEPAKGEYSSVLGGYPNVNCLSTRTGFGKPLAMNPFAFPKGITALEHMDSLMSLLSTCWPMYAAMADILKDAVIQVYDQAGWDMSETGLPWDEEAHFPTFQDLLKILPAIIDKADYSKEVKGNYKGSLLTRIKSMTNGTNRNIFGGDCLSNDELFNRNVIVDISGIGSSENRALIMGVLVIRLNEFRRVERGMNRSLHHVTLLEEAHNLLSTNSVKAPGESSAVGGKAVELLNSAIAEMRSFGEGFIIIDQTPSKLDSSVIANTATKIAFNLQNSPDSLSMGKSMTLTIEQSDDISTLPQGVCIVRSRGWMAPVKIKVAYFSKSNHKPFKAPPASADSKNPRLIRGEMLKAILDSNVDKANNLAKDLSRDEGKDRLLLDALKILQIKKNFPITNRTALYRGLFETANWFYPPNPENLMQWDLLVRKQLKRRAVLEKNFEDRIIQNLLSAEGNKVSKELLESWLALNKNN